MVRTMYFFIFLLAAGVLSAQPDAMRTLYPERLHGDIEQLRSALHEAHPDPYRYHTKAELDAIIDHVRDAINAPMNVLEFSEALQPIFRAVGDAHCRADWSVEMTSMLMTKAPLIPIQIRILPDGVFVEDELKGFRSIPVGSRIVSINDKPIEDVVQRLVDAVITDGANRTYAERLVEREFPQRYHTYIEEASSFKVGYRTPSKEAGEQTVFAMTGTDIARTRKPLGSSLLPWGSTWDPESGVVWINMRTLDADSLGLASQRPDRFLQAILVEAQKNKARTLVFDVRGAGGRELAMAELVFSAIAKTPFKVLDDMYVRSIAPPQQRPSLVIPEEHYASANSRFLRSSQGGTYRLPETDSRLEEHEPMQRAFQGKVYVVCDGYTRDAAAAFVMMARRTRRARVVGEETGSNAFGFTGGPEWLITGRSSGLRFHIPLMKYVPAGRGEGPVDRGEQPNHQAYQTPGSLANGRDSIRSSLLEMIRELE